MDSLGILMVVGSHTGMLSQSTCDQWGVEWGAAVGVSRATCRYGFVCVISQSLRLYETDDLFIHGAQGESEWRA